MLDRLLINLLVTTPLFILFSLVIDRVCAVRLYYDGLLSVYHVCYKHAVVRRLTLKNTGFSKNEIARALRSQKRLARFASSRFHFLKNKNENIKSVVHESRLS